MIATSVWAQEQGGGQTRGRGMRGVGNVEQAVTLTAEQKEKVTALRDKLGEQMRERMGQPDTAQQRGRRAAWAARRLRRRYPYCGLRPHRHGGRGCNSRGWQQRHRRLVVGGTLTVSGSISENGWNASGNLPGRDGTVCWTGGTDFDGHVDVIDPPYLVDAFGSVTGDANHDLNGDFNGNGSVDAVDLLILVENFG